MQAQADEPGGHLAIRIVWAMKMGRKMFLRQKTRMKAHAPSVDQAEAQAAPSLLSMSRAWGRAVLMDRRGQRWLRPRIWEMRKRQRGFRKRQDLGQSLQVEMGFNKWNWGGEEGLLSQERLEPGWRAGSHTHTQS